MPRRMDHGGPLIGTFPLRERNEDSGQPFHESERARKKNMARTWGNHELVSFGPNPQKPYLVLHRE